MTSVAALALDEDRCAGDSMIAAMAVVAGFVTAPPRGGRYPIGNLGDTLRVALRVSSPTSPCTTSCQRTRRTVTPNCSPRWRNEGDRGRPTSR